MSTDEHDKRAREVLAKAAKVQLRHGTPEAAAVIASALRSTAAAAERRGQDAERERCRAIAAEFGADDAWHPERRHASSSIADAIAAAPIAPLASPAQAERVSETQAALHHMDGVFAERHRIAARLRATADDVETFVPDHAYAATVLRSEADALEGT